SHSPPSLHDALPILSAYGARDHDAFEFPISSKHKMLEALTVFDDVFVPWERVFLYREPELAGRVSLAFVEFHRFTAVSYKLPLRSEEHTSELQSLRH